MFILNNEVQVQKPASALRFVNKAKRNVKTENRKSIQYLSPREQNPHPKLRPSYLYYCDRQILSITECILT